MNKTIRLSLLFLLIATRFGGVAYGQYLGKFTLAQTNKTTNPLVYNGAYDSYTFQVESFSPLDASKYDSVGLYFSSSTSSFLETGSTTFLQVASNPTVFGFEAPDTFFVLPAGFHGTPLSVVDTNSTLSVVFTRLDFARAGWPVHERRIFQRARRYAADRSRHWYYIPLDADCDSGGSNLVLI